jgi:Pyridoxamine 5'-phosphate oxidase
VLSFDDPAVRAFVGRSMIVEVATLSPKRRPFVTPLWFVLDRGAFCIMTAPGTWAGRNIQEHPAVTLLFNAGDAGRSDVLRVRGTASCHRGLPSWRVLLRIAAKYYLPPPGLLVELRNRHKWRLRTQSIGRRRAVSGTCASCPRRASFCRVPEVR